MCSITRSRFWRLYVTDIEDHGDRLSAAYRAATPRAEANRKAVVVLITAALSLTILNFGATSQPVWLITAFDGLGLGRWADWARGAFQLSEHSQRNGLMFWGIGQIFAYTVPPPAGHQGRLAGAGGRLRASVQGYRAARTCLRGAARRVRSIRGGRLLHNCFPGEVPVLRSGRGRGTVAQHGPVVGGLRVPSSWRWSSSSGGS